MLRVGPEEIEALARVVNSGKMFRYSPNGECGRFEERYAQFLQVHHVVMCSSGTAALTAALAAVGLGPGDEVIVPAHTYMATAIAVLAVGAIPIIADIDESITIDPRAVREAVGPRTRGVIPVHMWGELCDMDAIMEVAREKKLLVIEDACQCVGGFYKGQAAGAIGHVGAFSFNYYKNMTCGEGGAVATNDEEAFQRARCMIDPCSFYWEGRQEVFKPFVNCGSRASEFEGALCNAQLDRLPGLIETLRRYKKRVLAETAETALTPSPRHAPEGECATAVMYLFDAPEAAEAFREVAGGTILANTGRHNYTEWDPILTLQGAHHPSMNPFNFPENAECRKEYSKDMCRPSLDILARTVSVGLSPNMTDEQVGELIANIKSAAAAVSS